MSQLFNTQPPIRLRSASMSKLHRNTVEFVKEILVAPKLRAPKIVTIYGPEGCGKSYIASAIQNYWLDEGRLVYWTDCNLWPRDYKEAESAISRALMSRIWIADDLGREHETSRVSLSRALMAFMNLGDRVLITTTNLQVNKKEIDMCELSVFYGRAERSRLLSNLVLHIEGPDFRLS